LARTGRYLRTLTGWRALLAAILTGGVSALGFAPLGIFPALLLGFAVLVLLLDGAVSRPRPLRQAALVGWGFGFGQFVVGMHWIFYPFLVDPLEHAWQIPFVLILLPGGLALFPTLATTAAARFWRTGAPRILLLAATYAAAEWLRGHVFTGFPWNLPAYGWGASLAVMQSAAFLGAYGLSLLTVLFGASLAELFEDRPRPALPVGLTALFAALWVGGVIRLIVQPTDYVAGTELRLVQPNIPQDQKYVRALAPRNWRTLMDLSTRPGGTAPNVIVWPEAAPPVILQYAPGALDQIAVFTGRTRALVTGNQRVSEDATGARHFFNSLYVFGHGGQLLSTYDKFHLVPFGEYLPFEPLLQSIGITKIVGFPGSFASGDGPRSIAIPGAPDAGPLICYEVLFPGAVVGGTRPQWLLNVTDDSWFGPWAGPRQHLLAARMRSIEEGLPLARAANTGISAVIDAQGRIVASLDLGRTGVVDSRLPRAGAPTPYTRYGDLLFLVLLLLLLALPGARARFGARRVRV
jgi:apolipoprotein N-acyltransferase